jgi:hypothetical protein
MIENFHTKVDIGSLLISTTDPRDIGVILIGSRDLELKCALYYFSENKVASEESELDTPQVIKVFDRIKADLRSYLKDMFATVAKKETDLLLAKLKETNKPHEMGTIAEICLKYKISKSEARRMKAAGTLETLLGT